MASVCSASRTPISFLRASRLASRRPLPSRRHASTSPGSTTDSLLLARLKTLLYGGALAGSLYVTYLYATDTRASPHQWLVPRLLRLLFPDAEDAHAAGTNVLKTLYALGLHPRERDRSFSPTNANTPSPLQTSVFGITLANPIGISAGLDKHADIPDALFALGPAIVEVGGCTPLPQAGNPRPRMFRVPSLGGLVNRYGLNSLGVDDMAMRLRTRLRRFARDAGFTEAEVLEGKAGVPPGSLQAGKLLLVQIAKNKETDERDLKAVARDYVYCVRRLAPYADVLVVNVSSPNTPGLRDLQAAGPLTNLLGAVVDEAARCTEGFPGGRKERPKVMVKVSPDEEDDAQLEGVVSAVYASGVDGVIVGNTTKRRDGVVPPGVVLSAREQNALMEVGGYSGPEMFGRTKDLVRRYRTMLDREALRAPVDEGRDVAADPTAGIVEAVKAAVTGTGDGAMPRGGAQQHKVIFATGGITDGRQALEVLNAGASVAMVYTGLVYGGAGTITRMKREMRDAL